MGLFDRFKKKDTHAEDFKKAYEKGDASKLNGVLLDWLDNGKHDALFGLAMVILVALRRDKSLQEAILIHKSSLEQSYDDSDLYEWYKNTSINLLDDWAGDEINNNPELKKKFESMSKQESSTNFEELTCNDFAKTFKNLFDNLADDDGVGISYINQLNELLKVWERKCPDDSNLAAAHVLLEGPGLSKDEISDYVYKFSSGKCYDESLKEWYEDVMVLFIKMFSEK